MTVSNTTRWMATRNHIKPPRPRGMPASQINLPSQIGDGSYNVHVHVHVSKASGYHSIHPIPVHQVFSVNLHAGRARSRSVTVLDQL